MKKLTQEEERVIVHKGTELPFSGKYCRHTEKGTYVCKRCGAPLFLSASKFDAGCGWPAFDEEINGAVRRTPDADGVRTEITCAKCDAHLGHIFLYEGFTHTNKRYCVNSISMDFVPEEKPENLETAILAGGCFWGVEHLMKQIDGIVSIETGYTGGHLSSPTYSDVCTGKTGHAEAVRIEFDPAKVSYETILRHFFNIHDPEQTDGQGPDIGDQYRSEIFYTNEKQHDTAQKLIDILKTNGYKVATRLTPATTFWRAESYHQNYYEKTQQKPYCHIYKKRI